MKQFCVCILYIYLHRVGQCCGSELSSVRIRIILCADPNYPLCGSELSSVRIWIILCADPNYPLCGSELSSVRIRIILCADHNYPLCGSALSSVRIRIILCVHNRPMGNAKTTFPLRFCLDKNNGLQLQSYYQEWPKQAQGTTGNRIKKKCIRRLARLLPGVVN
jgi:hypothetical protein